MKALTLKRPWAHAVLRLGKRIENRSDKRGLPPMCKHRDWLLLHAGKGWNPGVGSFLFRRKIYPISSAVHRRHGHPTGIVGLCRVVGHIEPGVSGPSIFMGSWGQSRRDGQRHPDRMVFAKHASEQRYARDLDLRWWTGDCGLILDAVEALETPIPCNGRLGLWTPPADVLEQLPEGWL